MFFSGSTVIDLFFTDLVITAVTNTDIGAYCSISLKNYMHEWYDANYDRNSMSDMIVAGTFVAEWSCESKAAYSST